MASKKLLRQNRQKLSISAGSKKIRAALDSTGVAKIEPNLKRVVTLPETTRRPLRLKGDCLYFGRTAAAIGTGPENEATACNEKT